MSATVVPAVSPAGDHPNVLLALRDDTAVAVGFCIAADQRTVWSIVDGFKDRQVVSSQVEARATLLRLAEDCDHAFRSSMLCVHDASTQRTSTGGRMSAIDELVQALQAVHDELSNAANAASAASGEADSAMSAAQALGTTNAINGLASVKEQIESLTQQINGASDTADRAISEAKAVADGT